MSHLENYVAFYQKLCYIGFATHLYIENINVWYAHVKSVPLVRFTYVGIVQMCCNIEPRLRFYDAQLRCCASFLFPEK